MTQSTSVPAGAAPRMRHTPTLLLAILCCGPTACGGGDDKDGALVGDASDTATDTDPGATEPCGENRYVSNHYCYRCAAGTTNAAGDDPVGSDTACDDTLCAESEYVTNHVCIPCDAGMTNEAGDNASADNTSCEALLCAENQHVSNHNCVDCAPGTTNAAGDAATASDTSCDPTLCGEDQYVMDHACLDCTGGATNEPGDNASGDNTTCIEPISCIPAGSFTIGSPPAEVGRDADETQHTVAISRSFYIQSHKVTQGEWETLMGNNPSWFSSCGEDCPVEDVTWYEALAYANALSRAKDLTECYTLTDCSGEAGDDPGGLECPADGTVGFSGVTCPGYRLPTEAEWEYAARAGSTAAFYNGAEVENTGPGLDANLDEIAWYVANSSDRTHAVMAKEPNSWELYDIMGNVQEWTWDWYDTYPESATDPTGPESGTYRVQRGCSFSSEIQHCRSANRGGSPPHTPSDRAGFRLVRTLGDNETCGD